MLQLLELEQNVLDFCSALWAVTLRQKASIYCDQARMTVKSFLMGFVLVPCMCIYALLLGTQQKMISSNLGISYKMHLRYMAHTCAVGVSFIVLMMTAVLLGAIFNDDYSKAFTGSKYYYF